MTHRPLKWLAAVALLLAALIAMPWLWGAVFGWNWARAPLQNLVLKKTGRVLRVDGELDLSWGWPALHVRAKSLSFANPSWAATPQMLSADAVVLDVDVAELLHGRVVFQEVRLTRPRVFLEKSGERRNWLLDLAQSDETVRIPVGRLLLDRGELSYHDAVVNTDIHAALSTVTPTASGLGVVFTAKGRYRGVAITGTGRTGAVLALRDDTRPFPLDATLTLGATRVVAKGTVTSLLKFSAIDLRLELQGDNLATLYPLVGIALPPTRVYRIAGQLLRNGTRWRYENFTGTIGQSDVAGTVQVDTGGAKPLLSGAVTSHQLALADLGPSVGASPGTDATPISTASTATTPPLPSHMLPDIPFDRSRWAALDADVTLKAQSLLRDKALPLESLQMHVLLKNAVLTLDPLDFGLAGGQLRARITLDGRAEVLQGQANIQLRGLQLGKLLPSVAISKTSVGQMAGSIELAGSGASVGLMLGNADGRISLVAQDGQISHLLMEQIGLHLIEIAKLTISGDDNIRLNCAVADFAVARGVMSTRVLVVDTEVTTLIGSGSMDLGHETLDLTIVPHTKNSSLVALHGPVYIRGSFEKPAIALDTTRIAVRTGGAVALGLLNPLLALIPLFDAGPGVSGECGRLVRAARSAFPREAASAVRR